MAITARNNGFRKVAKWIVGAVVVAGATSANVAAESHLQGAKKVPFYAPEAVVFVTSLGKEYTNQDIDNLVDCTDLECTGSVWRHEITRRRAELLYRMEKFDKLMQQLPSDLVTAAMMYHTFEMLPEQLAKDITRYVFNANYNNLIDELLPFLYVKSLVHRSAASCYMCCQFFRQSYSCHVSASMRFVVMRYNVFFQYENQSLPRK
uniref:Spherical body protein 2 truncated copy 12 (SBP2) n=1 Tax=Babesia bovis TaxID=5865 RepID=S6BGI2_BABBO|nr:spherical body protein 2 truncated copy 12 (SBP2) [Babesia bovis]